MNKLTVVLLFAILAGCSSHKSVKIMGVNATEPFVIYKTKADYSHNVPVIMNAEKTIIVAYPAPSDLLREDELLLPTELINGFLLDNRGINRNVVFTSYTYERYAALSQVPSIEELLESIIDKDPLQEFHNCKNHLSYKYDLKAVNKLVRKGFPDCE